jgi:hypothetical protein
MTRFHHTLLTTACFGVIVFSSTWQFASSAAAEGVTSTILRVEEDWELLIGTPDQNSVSPQVTCVFAPTASSGLLTAVFELNHLSQPTFSAGGLHLQVWRGEYPVASRSSRNHLVMSQNNERVRWTQAMTLTTGQLTFEVFDGTSTTWGAFGNDGSLSITMPTTLTDLNFYDPQVSVDHSGIGYASHRVQSLSLNRIRWITSEGHLLEDSHVRTIFPRN